ncbi:MAG: hypothetical protein ACI82Q_003037 [Nonlabens sp.]|jgi:hypothetical protein
MSENPNLKTNSGKNVENNDPPITLSSALLAPLGSIFEAQVHAARSFLNFLLKMGFKHKYTAEDLNRIKKDAEDPTSSTQEQSKQVIDKQAEMAAAKEEIEQLRKKSVDGQLTQEELSKLKELNVKSSDLFVQNIDYIDQQGNEMMVSIPNLALLPIKPLSILEADISYEFQVKETKKWSTKDDGDSERPWFLIKEPKSIRGHFAPRKEESSDSTIKVSMKIGTTEMPHGLEKLMVHLTNSIESIDKQDD